MKFLLIMILLYIYDKFLFYLTNKFYCWKYKKHNKYGCSDWSCKKNLDCVYSKWYEVEYENI